MVGLLRVVLCVQVVKGTMTPDQALTQFLTQWDTKKADGVVEWEEFLEYYDSVSCSIDDDDYFELMMRNAWHLPGGTGWCENVSGVVFEAVVDAALPACVTRLLPCPALSCPHRALSRVPYGFCCLLSTLCRHTDRQPQSVGDPR